MNSEKTQAAQAEIDTTTAATTATTPAMKPMTLHLARTRNNPKNVCYEYKAEVQSFDDMLKVAQYDHVGATYKDTTNEYGYVEKCHRAKKNFIEADAVMMDLDNDDAEKPEEWLTPEDLAKRFPDCMFYAIFSQSHNRIKHEGEGEKERSPRPRFHVYFPLEKKILNHEEYKHLKERLRIVAPELDEGAEDAARFFRGVENPEGLEFRGVLCVDTYLDREGIVLQEGESMQDTKTQETGTHQSGTKPKEKSVLSQLKALIYNHRHDTLIAFGNAVLKAYGDSEIAEKLYWTRTLDCVEPYPETEYERLWTDCKAHFHDWVKNSDWIPPTDRQIQYARNYLKKLNGETVSQKKEKRLNLTLPAVENAIKECGLTARLNAVTREVEVSDFPMNSPLVPESYKDTKEATREKNNVAMLPVFLSAFLREKNYGVNDSFLNGALNVLVALNEYNPFEEMLKAEAWDGIDRITPIGRALGLDVMDSHYPAFLQKWLWQAVSMALNDDAELGNEFCLVLQGAEGLGKTEFFRKLAMNRDWFLDGAQIDTNDKDSVMRATRVLICELGELDATLNREQSALKSFLTAKFDVYRAPYGKTAQKYERRTTFCATVNPEKFLRDNAGSRRWVVIPVEWIDKKFVFETMSPAWVAQLWRQVYTQLYLAKGRKGYILTDEEKQFTRAENCKSSVEVDGEIELLDMLDWNTPPEKWRWYTNSQIISNLCLYKLSAVKMARALRAIMNKDKRVQRKHDRGGNYYLLPPKKGNADEVFPQLTEEEAKKFLR